MNTSFYIAKRYLFSKKSLNAINIISGISVLGVFVGSAALIVILSVFNGFENVVLSMYNTFTPEIRIEPSSGKTFYPEGPYFSELKRDKRIENYTEVLQEKALIRYKDGQYIGVIKGVSNDFLRRYQLDSTIIEGSFTLKKGGTNYAVVGSLVQSYLSLNVNDQFSDLMIYSPRKGAGNSINPADEFVVKSIHPAGVFQIQQQFDETVIVPMNFARDLLEEERNISSIEIYLKKGESVDKFHDEVSKKLGDAFIIKDRVQQNELLYKILNSEKWAIFIILTFVLIIAVFNIVGSLTMLVLDKKKDIAILSSIGAGTALIRKIFFIEGMMIALTGCISGMLAGLIFCLLQQHYGFIKMAEGNSITESYPVGLKVTDFILIFFTVTGVSVITSGISSRLSVKSLRGMKEEL
ncbi:ABC transporter permease [Arcticibacter tournemirensis]|uniref:ABC transporter permease n=1 Tax=Arcticibacter tournemirensis TaxID=699437 RepID=A0A4Q0MEV0_9SPHI|nr:FtsX-like permease family protein [Arcticibacter tournemirensis]RXF71794.1 ABC transporter permease [Arcticibacter tournemirensis]